MKRSLVVLLALGMLFLLVAGAGTASGPYWDVSGEWNGSSGLVDNLIYKFNMDLTQANGIVSGTFKYYVNASNEGTIDGYVEGDAFYFTRHDYSSSYWATCWPCTIAPGGASFHGFGADSSGRAVEWEAAGQATRLVLIDIKPGSDPNSINLCSQGVVPVAILTANGFDATTVDPASVQFAGADISVKGKGALQYSLEDVDEDGDLDFVAHIRVENLDLDWGSTEAALSGTADGVPFSGPGSVDIVKDCP